MDAGARGRRLLQRREYKAKVSEFIPKELEDHVVYENDSPGSLLSPAMADKVTSGINKMQTKFDNARKNSKVFRAITNVFKSKNPGGQYGGANNPGKSAFKEANSDQMKAMNDAKMKKMEDDKVSEKKKKKVDEACWKGYTKKGMKTMFGKRYPNCVKKTKKEEVQYEGHKNPESVKGITKELDKAVDMHKSQAKRLRAADVSEDMKGMSQKSGDKRSTESGAGMTAKGVAKYNRRTGGNLKTAVTTPPSKLKAGSKAAGRRKSFCARSKSWTGPRGKAARRRWNCEFEPELPMIPESKKKLYNTSPLSARVSNWAKSIKEGDTYVKTDRNKFGLPKDLKSVEKKVEKKTTGVNYGAMAQSYTPQGEMIERKMTTPEKKKKEDYVKGMKKDKGGFTKRYGKEGKSVMYATATKMAMKEGSCGKGEYYCTDRKKCMPIPKGAKVGKDGMLVKEAKVDRGKDDAAKRNERNQRTFGNRRDSKGSVRHSDDTEARQYNTKKGRGVKMKGKKDKTPVNYREIKRQKAISSLFKGMKEDFYRKKYDVKDGGYKKTTKMTKSNKRSGDSKAQHRELHKDLAKIKEGSLHKWFSGSKSKDGKGGWVNVVTGGTCASDKPGEGTPKCVSSSKRASMSKSERLSASRRKKKADPGQQSKSGAAKPTYVATDKKKKVDEMNQGPSTPVGNYDGKIMPKFGAGRIGKVRLKGGKSIADILKGV